jgi:uncharacterized protein involved in response to NO
MPQPAYSGAAVLSMGFRPFFLLAGLIATAAIPLWLLIYTGRIALSGPFAPLDWHIHEMLFGYTSAVVAGFLFTAVPNWTGRMPARGRPLALLAALWLAGRLAVAGLLGLGPLPVMLIDGAFLVAIGGMIGIEITAGRNWKNLKVLVPVTLYAGANLAFHLEALAGDSTAPARRAGFAVLILLVMLIGGRILPSFTRNWLAARGARRLPVPANRFDTLCLAAGALALLLWTARPESPATGAALLLAAALHVLRLIRWRGTASWRSPLLLMLHLAYAALPLGLAATACAGFGLAAPMIGFHILGIAAIGGMTLAVMMRAAMGHTGRPLEAGPLLTLAFAFIPAAALVRVLAGTSVPALALAGLLWTAGFALFCLKVGPWLLTARAGRRTAKRPAPARGPGANSARRT